MWVWLLEFWSITKLISPAIACRIVEQVPFQGLTYIVKAWPNDCVSYLLTGPVKWLYTKLTSPVEKELYFNDQDMFYYTVKYLLVMMSKEESTRIYRQIWNFITLLPSWAGHLCVGFGGGIICILFYQSADMYLHIAHWYLL